MSNYLNKKLRLELLALCILNLLNFSSCGSNHQSNSPGIEIPGLMTSALPSSYSQYPISTWWGYNMSKLVRYGNAIYYGIIEDDTGIQNTIAQFKIYKKKDNLTPTLIASIPVSRPGNILIDHLGRLHVITFEPFDISINDSIGSLVHYEFANVHSDNFLQTARTVIKEALSSSQEVVNIRIGATTNSLGHLAVSYGLNTDPITFTKALFLYTKSPTGSWVENKITSLAHEYYYPFVVYTDLNNSLILPVQDDYVPGSPAFNRYYKIPFFYFDGSSWSSSLAIDLSNDPLAVSDQEPHLVEQTELFEKSNGETVLIYKDKRSSKTIFKTRTVSTSGLLGPESNLSISNDDDLNWIRAFEIQGELFYFALSWESAYIIRSSSGQSKKIVLPGLLSGSYPYLSSGRGGSARNNLTTLDILLITGNSNNYPSPGTQLYQVSKQSLYNLFL